MIRELLNRLFRCNQQAQEITPAKSEPSKEPPPQMAYVDGSLYFYPPDADHNIPKANRLAVATARCHNCFRWCDNQEGSNNGDMYICTEVDTGCWLYSPMPEKRNTE